MSLLAPAGHGPGLDLRIAGIPVRVEWLFLLWTVVLGSTLGDTALVVAWVVVVTLSILVHELGHAAALAGWGVPSRIVLHTLGGVTMHRQDLPTRWSRIAVSLAGPAAGMLALGVPALLLDRAWPAPEPWDDVLVLVVWVNLGWALVNLLPVLPLDGGNVAHELLDAATRGRGEVPARVLSAAVAVGVGAWALVEGFVFGALFAAFFAFDNVRGLRGRAQRAAVAELRAAAVALDHGAPASALDSAAGVLAATSDPSLRAAAAELAAWAHLAVGDRRSALAVLDGTTPRNGHLRALLTEADPAEQVNATVDAWLAHDHAPAAPVVDALESAGLLPVVSERLLGSRADGAAAARRAYQHALFVAGRFAESARVGEATVALGEADPTVAYNVACAHARTGRPEDALRWLVTAVGLGFTDTGLLDSDPDLDAVRDDPRFAALRRRVPT